MTVPNSNPLISPHKSSDDGLRAQLHPLALLSISDYITRHKLRQLPGPMVGALLGQQNGREISIEVAFECKCVINAEGAVVLDQAWFDDRLQQFKDVHKSSPFELVGWFTVASPSGPQPVHLPIHRQILTTYNESAVLLTFHPTLIPSGSGKLPLTIYESVEGAAGSLPGASSGGGGGAGAEEGPKSSLLGLERQPDLHFREMAYSIETGEAERICVDFVAQGGANATTTVTAATHSSAASSGELRLDPAKSDGTPTGEYNDAKYLSAEDEELIASLTTRANAVKMLHSRIRLLHSYLSHLPPSYLTPNHPPPTSGQLRTEIHHPILRSIHALLNRIPLLAPSSSSSSSSADDAFQQETLAQKNDVYLISLLGAVGNSVRDMRETGRKFGAANFHKVATKRPGGFTVHPAGGAGAGAGASSLSSSGVPATFFPNMMNTTTQTTPGG